jgi:hypothetical protein
MHHAVQALPPSARVLYLALLGLRGARVVVQLESLQALRPWARVRGVQRFDEDLSVLINRGLVLPLDQDEVQLLTPEQSEGAAIFAQAERDWSLQHD